MTGVAKFPGLFRRGGRYSLRMIVPKDLMQSYGRAEISRALGTSDANEAKRRARSKSAEYDRRFDEHCRRLASVARIAGPAAAGDLGSRNAHRRSETIARAHYVAVKKHDAVDSAKIVPASTRRLFGLPRTHDEISVVPGRMAQRCIFVDLWNSFRVLGCARLEFP